MIYKPGIKKYRRKNTNIIELKMKEGKNLSKRVNWWEIQCKNILYMSTFSLLYGYQIKTNSTA